MGAEPMTQAPMTHETDPDALGARARLPDALRALVEALPREGWDAHPAYSDLIGFWLGRHMLFRDLLTGLRAITGAALDGGIAPREFARGLSRQGGLLVGELHGHHRVEDVHDFPVLRTLDPRVQRGFDILDRHHDALDGHLQRFAEDANAVLRGAPPRPKAEPTAPAPCCAGSTASRRSSTAT